MFSQRKTECYPTVIPSWNFVVWYVEENFSESMNCNAAPMWRFLCAMQLKCSSVGGRKKIGVDWPRPSRFRKNSSKSQCSNQKIGVDRSREIQKRPLQRQVSFNFFRTGHQGVAECVLHFDGLPLTRGAVVATPFAAAVSLTFSLVKNLQMLLQAKRQPG